MSILEELHKPDILDCISHLSSDEVFTPPKLVNEILDMLPQELFRSSKTKFLDPCCKSGVFLREIAKRLIEGIKDEIPDLDKRVEHIFKNQLYGLAITELTSLISRRSLYCSKTANGEYSICPFSDYKGNIEYMHINHVWKLGRCEVCGASREKFDKRDVENHAYSFIHANETHYKELWKRLKDMKFDVIIGNPPYQLNDGGAQASASPLYHLFVQQAKKLNPRYITMIIPARWYSGGKGLDAFRDEMLNDSRIREIHDFMASNDCFAGPAIEGGICYFLWERDCKGLCSVYTHKDNNITSTLERKLLEEGCTTFVRFNEAISILKKIKAFKEKSMETEISSRKPFGLATNFKDFKDEPFENSIKIYANSKVGYVKKSQITKELKAIDKYKIFISKAYGYGSNAAFPHQIINKPFLGEINSCCTETYLMVGPYNNKTLAENALKYMKTRFFRFFILLKKNTQDNPKGVFEFVPIQDFNEEWTDEKLYKKYGLTQEEIDYIESMIKPME